MSENNGTNGTGELVKRGYRPLRLNDARTVTPSPTGVGAWAEKLRDAAYDAVKEEDVQEMMKKQIEKAKAGDVKATQFVLNFLTKPAPAIRVQNVVVREPAPRKGKGAKSNAKPEALARRRRAAAKMLMAGPRTAADLAEALGLTEKAVEKVLEHEWFVRHLNKRDWQVTSLGRQEAGR